MSHSDHLSSFATQVGFTVEIESEVVRAVGVPCLLKGGVVGTCTIETSFDATSGKPTKTIGGDVHCASVSTNQHIDGCVYNADGTLIGNHIGGDGKSWSNFSIKKGAQGKPQEDQSARELVHRYAKQTVGAVRAAGHSFPATPTVVGPFSIPHTFEARAGVASVQDRIRGQSVAIFGLGGTGSYVLDLVAKSPVKEIHLFDADIVRWHNLFRAPSAPTPDEIEAIREGDLLKVHYYASKYAPLRDGIYPHPVQVDGTSMWREFLSTRPIDFAFVCIDQLLDCDSPRQDAVYRALSEEKTPFIDSGVSITVDGDAIRGAVTTSCFEGGSLEWERGVPNPRVTGDLPGYRNVQLPEVNALAASLAVMEWRRRTGQYVSESTSILHKLRLEGPNIVASTAAEGGSSP